MASPVAAQEEGAEVAAPSEPEAEGAVDPASLPWDRGYARLGVFVTAIDSGFRVGLDNLGLGIVLAAETFLGLDRTNTAFRIDAGWRYSKNRRHKIMFDWFELNRSGLSVLTEDIELPDEPPIEAGTSISSVFNFDLLKAKYDYSAILDKRIDFHLGAGLYIMPIEFGVSEVGEENPAESITAPLPVLSIGIDVALTPKWFIRQNIDFMYLEISGFRGSIADFNVSIERQLTKNFGLGAGLETLDITIDSEKEGSYPNLDFIGEVNFEYTGIQVYFRGAF